MRIAPGTYRERITIQRSVVLEGAGADRVHLTASYDLHPPAPTLRIESAGNVAISGIKISRPGVHDGGGIGSSNIVEVDRSSVRFERCAVVGSPGHGITIGGASDVQIRGCLVAGVGNTGIRIMPGTPDAKPNVRVIDSDVRDCYHRGITIGVSSAWIEGCRISGSAWHGIRYDGVSPTIVSNAIFGNARFGIYASGETGATVRGNLFFENGMCGIGCWFQNADRIEGNTFVGDRRAGVEVLGASRPSILRNVFFRLERGVRVSKIGGNHEHAEPSGEVAIQGNVFWQVKNKAVWKQALDAAEDNRNVVVDPGFVDVDARDFALKKGGAARKKGIGAASPPSLRSPWAVQPEEVEQNKRNGR